VAALRNAIASHPESPKLQSSAGRMLINAGERDEGLAAMQRAGARRSGAAAEAARRFGVAKSVAYEQWEE
ncbi:MAG TPA: hypothetical protein PKA49_03980, partial [Tepidiformaceae bacterium]|nr:hypothetical protein [Tepidiformaceae bacterium]